MALIVRIDVDRAYGKRPFWRHALSRASSDAYFPRLNSLGYLAELAEVLRLMNAHRARSMVFFRRCTLPSAGVMDLLLAGSHGIGLHLEDSRSFDAFERERTWLETNAGTPVLAFSKHGSGGAKYGRRHHAPYEPDRYIEWGRRSQMSAFLGNLEDPGVLPFLSGPLLVHPAAFWLEPPWRDRRRFDVCWLKRTALARDVVLLIHPENVLADPELTAQLADLVSSLPTKLV